MGKRKSSSKPPPRKKVRKLDTVFDCLFCGHEATCDCFIDKVKLLGSIRCRVCGAEHTSKVNLLEEAVDVYANWIDANQKENRDEDVDEVESKDDRRYQSVESDSEDDQPRRSRAVLSDDDDEEDDD